ncbi:MAG: GNAT family N-acetyltransferase [Gallionella sp.]|nr:GNAT family N-acetyltransferase [Gallionella sp.]
MEIRSCQLSELDQLIQLLDEEFIFGKGRIISLRQRFPTVFCRNNLHNIMICADGEEIVSALAMRQFDWRENGETLQGAMIGAVYTHPAHRKKGLSSRLLEASAIQLHEQGVDFGVLWSEQQSFYARLGWVPSDCGVLGKAETGDLMPEPSGDVTILPLVANAPRLEGIRQHQLNSMILRRPDDYRQLPVPAESVNVLWHENQGKAAYALLGSSGETRFLYELAGDTACFLALWREACRDCRQILINDRAGSPSFHWLTDQTGVSWKNKSLAMWLPLSERVSMTRLRQWHIPYFDRI